MHLQAPQTILRTSRQWLPKENERNVRPALGHHVSVAHRTGTPTERVPLGGKGANLPSALHGPLVRNVIGPRLARSVYENHIASFVLLFSERIVNSAGVDPRAAASDENDLFGHL